MRAVSMRLSNTTTLRVVVTAFLLASLSTVFGCGDGRVARYPVFGAVHVDGQPAAGAIVVFCPTETSPEAERLRPAGRTDVAGNFKLTTIDPDDGAPAGTYKIMVQWPEGAEAAAGAGGPNGLPAAAVDRGGRGGPRPADRLQGKYYSLERTPLTASVEEQANELPPFELTSK